MKFISFGALVVDYYYKNNKFLGRMNGRSFSNICVHLKSLGQSVFIYGTVGNDEVGKFALCNLKKLQIETKIEILNQKTNRICIIDNHSTKVFENEKYWYIDRYDYPLIAEEQDIVIVDNINKNTLCNLNGLSCEIVLDIGTAISFVYMSKEEIFSCLANRFTIINMNEKVFQVLKKKLNVDEKELQNLLHVKLLVITYGSKGITFVSSKCMKKCLVKKPFKEIDSFGAGDAFFSIILDCYVQNNREVDESFMNTCFSKGNLYVKQILNHYGALGPILPLEN